MAGLVPAIHDCHARESRHPVTTVVSHCALPGLLDRRVKPGDDKRAYPRPPHLHTLHAPRPLEGRFSRAFVKRDEVRRLRARVRNMSARAVPELLPDPIGGPAGSQRKDRSAHSSVTDRTKARPGAVWTP